MEHAWDWLTDEKMLEAAKKTFWGYLGCELASIDDREVVVTLDIEPHHLNMIGIVHGGVHTTLLDSAMGLIAMAARPGEDVVTSALNMHFTAPVRQGRVTVTASIVHQSGRMITTEGRLVDEAGKLCSMATASFRVIDRHPK